MKNNTMNFETYIENKINKIAYNRYIKVLPEEYITEFKNRYLQTKWERDEELQLCGVEDEVTRNRIIIRECRDLEHLFKKFEKQYLFRYMPTPAFA